MEPCSCCRNSHQDIPLMFDDCPTEAGVTDILTDEIIAELGDTSLSWFDELTEKYLIDTQNQEQGVSVSHVDDSVGWSPCPRGGILACPGDGLMSGSVIGLLSETSLDLQTFSSSSRYKHSVENLCTDQLDITWTSAMATPVRSGKTSISPGTPQVDSSPVTAATASVGCVKPKVFHRQLFSPATSPARDDSLTHILEACADGNITVESERTLVNEEEFESTLVSSLATPPRLADRDSMACRHSTPVIGVLDCGPAASCTSKEQTLAENGSREPICAEYIGQDFDESLALLAADIDIITDDNLPGLGDEDVSQKVTPAAVKGSSECLSGPEVKHVDDSVILKCSTRSLPSHSHISTVLAAIFPSQDGPEGLDGQSSNLRLATEKSVETREAGLGITIEYKGDIHEECLDTWREKEGRKLVEEGFSLHESMIHTELGSRGQQTGLQADTECDECPSRDQLVMIADVDQCSPSCNDNTFQVDSAQKSVETSLLLRSILKITPHLKAAVKKKVSFNLGKNLSQGSLRKTPKCFSFTHENSEPDREICQASMSLESFDLCERECCELLSSSGVSDVSVRHEAASTSNDMSWNASDSSCLADLSFSLLDQNSQVTRDVDSHHSHSLTGPHVEEAVWRNECLDSRQVHCSSPVDSHCQTVLARTSSVASPFKPDVQSKNADDNMDGYPFDDSFQMSPTFCSQVLRCSQTGGQGQLLEAAALGDGPPRVSDVDSVSNQSVDNVSNHTVDSVSNHTVDSVSNHIVGDINDSGNHGARIVDDDVKGSKVHGCWETQRPSDVTAEFDCHHGENVSGDIFLNDGDDEVVCAAVVQAESADNVTPSRLWEKNDDSTHRGVLGDRAMSPVDVTAWVVPVSRQDTHLLAAATCVSSPSFSVTASASSAGGSSSLAAAKCSVSSVSSPASVSLVSSLVSCCHPATSALTSLTSALTKSSSALTLSSAALITPSVVTTPASTMKAAPSPPTVTVSTQLVLIASPLSSLYTAPPVSTTSSFSSPSMLTPEMSATKRPLVITSDCPSSQPFRSRFRKKQKFRYPSPQQITAECSSILPVTVECSSILPVTVECSSILPVTSECSSSLQVTSECSNIHPVTAECSSIHPVTSECSSIHPVTAKYSSKQEETTSSVAARTSCSKTMGDVVSRDSVMSPTSGVLLVEESRHLACVLSCENRVMSAGVPGGLLQSEPGLTPNPDTSLVLPRKRSELLGFAKFSDVFHMSDENSLTTDNTCPARGVVTGADSDNRGIVLSAQLACKPVPTRNVDSEFTMNTPSPTWRHVDSEFTKDTPSPTWRHVDSEFTKDTPSPTWRHVDSEFTKDTPPQPTRSRECSPITAVIPANQHDGGQISVQPLSPCVRKPGSGQVFETVVLDSNSPMNVVPGRSAAPNNSSVQDEPDFHISSQMWSQTEFSQMKARQSDIESPSWSSKDAECPGHGRLVDSTSLIEAMPNQARHDQPVYGPHLPGLDHTDIMPARTRCQTSPHVAVHGNQTHSGDGDLESQLDDVFQRLKHQAKSKSPFVAPFLSKKKTEKAESGQKLDKFDTFFLQMQQLPGICSQLRDKDTSLGMFLGNDLEAEFVHVNTSTKSCHLNVGLVKNICCQPTGAKQETGVNTDTHGFTTASGKLISVSETARSQAFKLLQDSIKAKAADGSDVISGGYRDGEDVISGGYRDGEDVISGGYRDGEDVSLAAVCVKADQASETMPDLARAMRISDYPLVAGPVEATSELPTLDQVTNSIMPIANSSCLRPSSADMSVTPVSLLSMRTFPCDLTEVNKTNLLSKLSSDPKVANILPVTVGVVSSGDLKSNQVISRLDKGFHPFKAPRRSHTSSHTEPARSHTSSHTERERSHTSSHTKPERSRTSSHTKPARLHTSSHTKPARLHTSSHTKPARLHTSSHTEPARLHTSSHTEPERSRTSSHTEPERSHTSSHTEPARLHTSSHTEPERSRTSSHSKSLGADPKARTGLNEAEDLSSLGENGPASPTDTGGSKNRPVSPVDTGGSENRPVSPVDTGGSENRPVSPVDTGGSKNRPVSPVDTGGSENRPVSPTDTGGSGRTKENDVGGQQVDDWEDDSSFQELILVERETLSAGEPDSGLACCHDSAGTGSSERLSVSPRLVLGHGVGTGPGVAGKGHTRLMPSERGGQKLSSGKEYNIMSEHSSGNNLVLNGVIVDAAAAVSDLALVGTSNSSLLRQQQPPADIRGASFLHTGTQSVEHEGHMGSDRLAQHRQGSFTTVSRVYHQTSQVDSQIGLHHSRERRLLQPHVEQQAEDYGHSHCQLNSISDNSVWTHVESDLCRRNMAGFQTASGVRVSVSANSLLQARKMLAQDSFEENLPDLCPFDGERSSAKNITDQLKQSWLHGDSSRSASGEQSGQGEVQSNPSATGNCPLDTHTAAAVSDVSVGGEDTTPCGEASCMDVEMCGSQHLVAMGGHTNRLGCLVDDIHPCVGSDGQPTSVVPDGKPSSSARHDLTPVEHVCDGTTPEALLDTSGHGKTGVSLPGHPMRSSTSLPETPGVCGSTSRSSNLVTGCSADNDVSSVSDSPLQTTGTPTGETGDKGSSSVMPGLLDSGGGQVAVVAAGRADAGSLQEESLKANGFHEVLTTVSGGFSTASGCHVSVSKRALLHARNVLTDHEHGLDDSVHLASRQSAAAAAVVGRLHKYLPGQAPGMASSSPTVSLETQPLRSPGHRAPNQPSSGRPRLASHAAQGTSTPTQALNTGFSTANGCRIYVSEDAFKGAKGILADAESSDGSLTPEYCSSVLPAPGTYLPGSVRSTVVCSSVSDACSSSHTPPTVCDNDERETVCPLLQQQDVDNTYVCVITDASTARSQYQVLTPASLSRTAPRPGNVPPLEETCQGLTSAPTQRRSLVLEHASNAHISPRTAITMTATSGSRQWSRELQTPVRSSYEGFRCDRQKTRGRLLSSVISQPLSSSRSATVAPAAVGTFQPPFKKSQMGNADPNSTVINSTVCSSTTATTTTSSSSISGASYSSSKVTVNSSMSRSSSLTLLTSSSATTSSSSPATTAAACQLHSTVSQNRAPAQTAAILELGNRKHNFPCASENDLKQLDTSGEDTNAQGMFTGKTASTLSHSLHPSPSVLVSQFSSTKQEIKPTCAVTCHEDSGYYKHIPPDVTLEESRMKQDQIIRNKQRSRVRPVCGRWLHYRKKREALRTLRSLGPDLETDLSRQSLLSRGVPDLCLGMTSLKAKEFRFHLQRFYPGLATCVLVGDGALLVPDKCGFAGPAEFYSAFLTVDGVDPKLVDEAWVRNHYRWIVWKLAMYEVCFPGVFAGRSLTPEMVMLQLKYRYDREIDTCHRSPIKKIVERDDSASRRLILCVASVDKMPDGQVSAELTDGWYSIPAQLDDYLCQLVARGRIRPGDKIVSCGAELLGCVDGCSPLEMKEGCLLRVSGNSTRPAPWYSKLGYSFPPSALCVPLHSLSVHGGLASCVDVVVCRRYPVMYMEKQPDGTCVFRTAEEEDRARQRHEDLRQMEAEKVYMSLQKETEDRDRRARRATSDRKCQKDISNLSSGQDLASALEDALNPEELQLLLSVSQMDSLLRYRQAEMDRRQQEVNRRLQETMAHVCAPRQVVPVVKFKVCGCCRSDVDSRSCCHLVVWRPGCEWEEVEEGKRYKLFNISVSSGRSRPQHGKLTLTAVRQTCIQACPISENLLDIVYSRRDVWTMSELLSGQPFENEFDFVGVVVQVVAASRPSSPTCVFAADKNQDILCLRLWTSCVGTALRPGTCFVASNLILCRSSKHPESRRGLLIADVRSDVTSISMSTRPSSRYSHQLADIRRLCQARGFLPDLQAKLRVDGLTSTDRHELAGHVTSNLEDDGEKVPLEMVDQMFASMSQDLPAGTMGAGRQTTLLDIWNLQHHHRSQCLTGPGSLLESRVRSEKAQKPSDYSVRSWPPVAKKTIEVSTKHSVSMETSTASKDRNVSNKDICGHSVSEKNKLLKRKHEDEDTDSSCISDTMSHRKGILRAKMSKLLTYACPDKLSPLPCGHSPASGREFKSPIARKF